jgi:hypothetical protein
MMEPETTLNNILSEFDFDSTQNPCFCIISQSLGQQSERARWPDSDNAGQSLIESESPVGWSGL